ncbi:hypothetical protein ACFL17_10290 [Pseudomonadota bacterium]
MDLFILKDLWMVEDQRLLTYGEILKSELRRLLKGGQYECAGN